MKGRLGNIFGSEVVRNFAKLFSASVLAQAVGVLVYPVLARMYTPADFGLLSLFLSLSGICGVVATAEYQNAIPLPADDKMAAAVMHGGGALLLAFSLLLCCALPFSGALAELLGSAELARYLWLVPVFVFVSGLWQLLNYWFTRQKRFNAVSGYQVGQTLTSAVLKMLFGARGVGGGLIIGTVAAPAVAVATTVAVTFRKSLRQVMRFDLELMRHALREYSLFPKFSLPKSLVNIVNCNIAVLLISPYFGLSEAGEWGMAMTLGFTPLGLILNSVYQVLFPRCAQYVQQGKAFLRQYRRSLLLTACVVMPSFLLLYWILPWLVDLLLGSGWDETARIIRYLLPWFAVMCMVMPWSFLPDVFFRQKKALGIEVAHLVLRLVAIGAGVAMGSMTVLLAGYALAGVVVSVYQLLWFDALVRRYEASATHGAE